jgi:pimeloyl-ACP methyl ester carboxylesterase
MTEKKKKWLKALMIAISILLLLVLVVPLLIPVPPVAGTVPPQELADPDSQFVEVDSLTVHVKTMGEGERVFILLHGFGASLFSWHAVMEPLSKHGFVIAYDRPAFGLTERPLKWKGVNPYSLEGNLALLVGLMDHYQVKSAVLVGNSAGGTLAMQFALAYPERVRALILVDPAVEGGGVPAWVRLLEKTPQMQHLGPLFVRSIQKDGVEFIRQAWHDPSRITQETWDGYTRPLKARDWDVALWDYTVASRDPGLLPHLSEFKMPMLLVTGDDDRIVPTVGTVRLAGELPGAHLSIIPEAGHLPHEEQPAAFMQVVEVFVSALPSPYDNFEIRWNSSET